MDFATQIKTERLRLGLSQAQCAALFVDLQGAPSLARHEWSKWERSARLPPTYAQRLILGELQRMKTPKHVIPPHPGRPRKTAD